MKENRGGSYISCRTYSSLVDQYVYVFLMGRIEMLVCQREELQVAEGEGEKLR